MTKKTSTSSEIESLVQTRKQSEARHIIRNLHRKEPLNTALTIQCCDWLRRLGQYEEGFRLLNLRQLLQKKEIKDLGSYYFWGARFLNNLGASRMALALADRHIPKSSLELRVVANIFLSNFKYEKALDCFEKMNGLISAHSRTYEERLAQVGYADSLAGLGRYEEAREHLVRLLETTREPLFRGILHQATGEYFAREGRIKDSEKWLKEALPFFPGNDTSPDHAFLLKWMGYVEVQLGRIKEGKAKLLTSLRWLQKQHVREESWIDVLRLLGECGLLSSPEMQSLLFYPGLSAPYLDLLKQSLSLKTPPLVPKPPKSGLFLAQSADEYWEDGRPRLGLPLELKYVAFAKLSAPWGMTKTRMKDCLWPDEPHAFLEMENRLKQLILRAKRRYRFSSRMKDSRVLASPGSLRKITMGHTTAPSALLPGSRFTKGELATYYGLSLSQVRYYLTQWETLGWIARLSGPKQASYRVSPPSAS